MLYKLKGFHGGSTSTTVVRSNGLFGSGQSHETLVWANAKAFFGFWVRQQNL